MTVSSAADPIGARTCPDTDRRRAHTAAHLRSVDGRGPVETGVPPRHASYLAHLAADLGAGSHELDAAPAAGRPAEWDRAARAHGRSGYVTAAEPAAALTRR